MNLLLLDAIGPFSRNMEKQRVNWPKIPFAKFHDGDRLDEVRLAAVADDFDIFCEAEQRDLVAAPEASSGQ